MNPDEKKFYAISASMEGEAHVVGGIGRKVKISEMELICLVNLAEIGCLGMFSELDGETGEKATAELGRHIEAIRKQFASSGGSGDGLNQLTRSTVALLRGRMIKYLVPIEPAGEGRDV